MTGEKALDYTVIDFFLSHVENSSRKDLEEVDSVRNGIYLFNLNSESGRKVEAVVQSNAGYHFIPKELSSGTVTKIYREVRSLLYPLIKDDVLKNDVVHGYLDDYISLIEKSDSSDPKIVSMKKRDGEFYVLYPGWASELGRNEYSNLPHRESPAEALGEMLKLLV